MEVILMAITIIEEREAALLSEFLLGIANKHLLPKDQFTFMQIGVGKMTLLYQRYTKKGLKDKALHIVLETNKYTLSDTLMIMDAISAKSGLGFKKFNMDISEYTYALCDIECPGA